MVCSTILCGAGRGAGGGAVITGWVSRHESLSDCSDLTQGRRNAQVAAELNVPPEVVRLMVGGKEFRDDAALLRNQNLQPPYQLQV